MSAPWSLGVAQAAAAIRANEVEPLEMAQVLLARIERLDSQLHAFVRVDPQAVMREAQILQHEAAQGAWRGPLHGVPIAVKDILDTAGLETCAGSTLLAGRVPERDAEAVACLRRAGALVLGKTAMTEFAAMDPALTRNPWNLAHTPGGSSSGSAAAVAAFLAPGALGTQTAGSIIRPAAYCGVVGLKPTYDSVSRRGAFPCAWSMDHVGPMTRSVADAALLFAVIAGEANIQPPKGDNVVVAPLRIGISDRYFLDQADADTRRAFLGVVDSLSKAGADIAPLELPDVFEAGVDAGVITMYAEMAAAHRDRFATSRDQYGWKLQCLIDAGMQVRAVDYLRAQQVRGMAAGQLSCLLNTVDCLLTPSTPAPAPTGLEATGDWTLNLPFSSSGHPTLTVPVALSAGGMPIGVQLAARDHGEDRLFRVGVLIEQLVNFNSSPFWNQ